MEPRRKRYMVITAYYKESRDFLDRCLRSVARQTVPADHMLVADGHPQAWLDDAGVRHIKLDRSHGDYGNTPRGIGSLLAMAENYDGFCYCDADNWFEDGHIEACLAAAAEIGDGCDYVIAQRYLRRPDETIMPLEDEHIDHAVDTNCFFFLPGSYHALYRFSNMPRELSSIGDRVFYAALKAYDLRRALVPTRTVNYHNLWLPSYAALGEAPPEGAKPAINMSDINAWVTALNPREREIASRRSGLVLAAG